MDNKITDKGWAAMQALLDREMPEKPRRRFGWWWFALLLLPLAVYGSWQWLGSTKETIPKQEAEPAGPIANKEAPLVLKSTILKAEQVLNTSNNAASITRKGVATAPFNDIEKQKPGPANSIYKALNDNKISVDAPIITLNQGDEIQNKQPFIDIAFLGESKSAPVLSMQVKDDSPRHFSISQTPKIAKNSSKKRWAFGATTAISTEQFNMINGFSTGVTVDWKFARKWGLRTGAMYNIHTPQEKYRPVASVRSADYRSNVYGVIVVDVATGQELNNTPGTNFYVDSLAGNVIIPVNRLQRLEVPVTVFWQAARPLKIIGGFSLTRTLTTKAASQNYSGDYILKLANETAEDGASKLSSSELDNWSIDATIGAGVKIGKSFEIGASAKMPLNKFPGITKSNLESAGAQLSDLGSTRKQNGPVFSVYTTLFF